MRTAAECLDQAEDMERHAAQCAASTARADYLHLAEYWRRMALQAHWQDAPGAASWSAH